MPFQVKICVFCLLTNDKKYDIIGGSATNARSRFPILNPHMQFFCQLQRPRRNRIFSQNFQKIFFYPLSAPCAVAPKRFPVPASICKIFANSSRLSYAIDFSRNEYAVLGVWRSQYPNGTTAAPIQLWAHIIKCIHIIFIYNRN